jgi:hypothetical protein
MLMKSILYILFLITSFEASAQHVITIYFADHRGKELSILCISNAHKTSLQEHLKIKRGFINVELYHDCDSVEIHVIGFIPFHINVCNSFLSDTVEIRFPESLQLFTFGDKCSYLKYDKEGIEINHKTTTVRHTKSFATTPKFVNIKINNKEFIGELKITDTFEVVEGDNKNFDFTILTSGKDAYYQFFIP